MLKCFKLKGLQTINGQNISIKFMERAQALFLL